MSLALFETFLKDFEKAMNLAGLHLDENNSCLLQFKTGATLQIELDDSEENVLFVSELGKAPPGTYRERLFIEALRANGMPYPRIGNFAYSQKADQLVLFDSKPLRELKPDQAAEFVDKFVEKAHLWKEAIEKGVVPAASVDAKEGSGMFGLSR